MKLRIIITVLMVAAMIVACSKSDTPRPSVPDGYTPSITPISFQTEDNWDDEDKTKAEELKSAFAEGDNIGVMGYYLPSNGESAPTVLGNDAIPNFMYDQKMIYDGTDWNYTPIKYWPNNENDRLQFFAYYPLTDSITLSSNHAKGYPKISFKPAANPSQQVDFMTATSAVVGKEDQRVTFNFKHQLSQVSFKAKHNGIDGDLDGDIDYEVYMTDIKLVGAKIYAGQFTADGFLWDTTNGIAAYDYVATDNDDEIDVTKLKYDSYTNVTNENGVMLLIPQELSNGDIEIHATFMAKLPNQDNMIEVTQVIKVTEAHTYRKGERLNYLFTINVIDLTVARFDKITITKWVDSNKIYTEETEIL